MELKELKSILWSQKLQTILWLRNLLKLNCFELSVWLLLFGVPVYELVDLSIIVAEGVFMLPTLLAGSKQSKSSLEDKRKVLNTFMCV